MFSRNGLQEPVTDAGGMIPRCFLSGLIILGHAALLHAQDVAVDVSALVRETQKHAARSGSLIFVQWMPVEIWTADPTIAPGFRARAEQVLAPHVLFLVAHHAASPEDAQLPSESDLQHSMRLVDAQGRRYAPLADETLTEPVRLILSELRPFFGRMFGALDITPYVLVFPNDESDRNRPFPRATENGSFSVTVGEEEFFWTTPLRSVVPK
jgi:hypothetical protein